MSFLKQTFKKSSAALAILALFLATGTLRAQKEDDIKTLLDMSFEKLMNLDITTAGKREERINEIPASVIVVTREEIQKYGYSTLDELLANIVGLYVYETYHVMGKISVGMRGYTTPGGGIDNIIVLVNGVNQSEGVYNQYLLPKIALAVDLIDRIEVVRGPMSVLYGSGAFFGAINIITRDPERSGRNFIQSGIGSNGSRKMVFKTAYHGKDFHFTFNASHWATDGIDKPYAEMMRDPSKLLDFGLPLDATSKDMLKDKRTYLNFSGEYSGFSVDATFSEYEKGGFLNQPSVDYSAIKLNTGNIMVGYNKKFSQNFRLEARFSLLNTSDLAYYFVNSRNSYISFAYNSNAFEIEADSFFTLSDALNLTFGLTHRNEYNADNPNDSEVSWGPSYARSRNNLVNDSSIRTNAVFTQAVWAPGKNIKLITGLRLEQMLDFDYETSFGPPTVEQGRNIFRATYNNNRIRFIPRLAVIVTPSKDSVIKFLYGEALRHPPIGQLADNLMVMAEYHFPSLKPAQIRTFELNYMKSFSSLAALNVSVFKNDLRDLISQKNFVMNNGETGLYSINGGKISTLGAELSIDINPLKNLNIGLGGTYQKSDIKTTGFEEMKVPYSPEFLGYLKAAYTFPKHLILSLNGTYIDAMESDYNINKMHFGDRSTAYFKLDCNLRCNDLLVRGMFASLRCANLLNQIIRYPVSSASGFADRGIFAPGRMIVFSAGYEF